MLFKFACKCCRLGRRGLCRFRGFLYWVDRFLRGRFSLFWQAPGVWDLYAGGFGCWRGAGSPEGELFRCCLTIESEERETWTAGSLRALPFGGEATAPSGAARDTLAVTFP